MVEQAFAFQYPNGRVHECRLRLARPLRPGSELELYGRRWRVQHVLPPDRLHPEPRLLCTPIDVLVS